MSHKTQAIYEGCLVQLGIETLTLPNGQALALEVVRHPGGAAVVAVDEHRRVCLLRQYRHAAGGWIWELPAGKLEPGEPPRLTAARELEEEAGLRADHWQKLGKTVTTPGFCDEVIHLFLATGLTRGSARPEAHELIEVHWLAFETALTQARDGTIQDAKSMLGLLLAGPLLRGQTRRP